MLLEFSLGVAVPLFVQEMLRPSFPGFFLRLLYSDACLCNQQTNGSQWVANRRNHGRSANHLANSF